MSGAKSSSKIDRRFFLRLCSMGIFMPLLSECVNKKKQIKTRISGANSNIGHLIRQNKFPKPNTKINTNTLIVGGGISGLSAARYLKQNNNDFLLLELDDLCGGNSQGGKNKISKYPYGAHYVPIPNNHLKELMTFFEECQIIEKYDENDLPIYNPYYLCHAPQERLFYKGQWHDNIPIKNGLNKEEEMELNQFHSECKKMKSSIGNDGKRAFDIPIENSSIDSKYTILDQISIYDYLKTNNYKSDFIYWYLNYCSKDDFGSDIYNTSAWAIFHYFCSRNGLASNAQNEEVLTWPEGNQFLVKQLESEVKENISTNSLLYEIKESTEGYTCLYYNTKNQTSIEISCKNIILATPQYMNKHLLKNQNEINWNEFIYNPWLVANVSIEDSSKLNSNVVLSWDNVNYLSDSLGYINSGHQSINANNKETVITYYYNFSDSKNKVSRKDIFEKSESDWKEFIITDLKKMHPDIENNITEIDIHIWGHGMVCPQIGFKNSTTRIQLQNGIGNIQFANTDISGISIFEQAFYNGIAAAKKTINDNENSK